MFKKLFSQNKELILDLFVLLGITILFGFRWVFIERYSLFTSDVVQDFSMHHFAAWALSQGEVPLWDPYFTWAFVAYLNSGFFYPFNLVMNFFQGFILNNLNHSYLLMQWNAFFHYFLASFFMYLFIRKIGVSRIASLISGIVFGYCGYLVKEYVHLAYLQGGVWLPLVFLFSYQSIYEEKAKRIKNALFAGLTFGISLLAGQTQPAIYIAFAVILFAFYAFVHLYRDKEKDIFRPVIFSVLFLVIAFGIFAIQFFPTNEYAKFSTREGLTQEEAILYSAQPLYLLTHPFIPTLWGGMASVFWSGASGQEMPLTDKTKWLYDMFGPLPNEMNFYLGLLPFFILPFAFFSKNKFLRNFFLLLLLASILLMMSRNIPIVGQFFYYLLRGVARVPVRASILYSFSLAVLTGLGLQAILDFREEKKEIFGKIANKFFLVFSALLLFALPILVGLMLSANGTDKMVYFYFPMVNDFSLFLVYFFVYSLILSFIVRSKTNFAIVILAGFYILELFSFHTNNSYIYPSNGSPETIVGKKYTPDIKYLKTDNGLFRVQGMGLTAYANNFYSLGYGSSGSSGFAYRPILELYSAITDDASPLYDLLNVKYFYAPDGVPNDLTSSVSASSFLKDHWPSLLFDQKENTAWVVDPKVKKEGLDWIGTTLRQPDKIARLEFLGRDNDLDKEAEQVDLLFSNGEIQHLSLPTKKGWKVVEIKPTLTSWIKIIFTGFDLSNGKNEAFGFREINLVNSSGQKIAVGSPKLEKIADTNLYLNKLVLPRAFVTYAYKTFNNPNELLNTIISDQTGIKMRQYAYFYTPVIGFVNPEKLPTTQPQVAIKEYKNKSVIVKVNMEANGFLILSDPWYLGWDAYLDNQKTNIIPAYHALRAVQVPKGVHEVVFKYEPTSFKIGSLITFLTIFLTGFYLFRISFVRNK